MESVPESWPPEPFAPEPVQVPLFPLANVWLFPRVVMPLHVFEPRYRKMVEDSLDGPGRIVIGTVMEGHEDEIADAPPCYSLAGIGEIGRHDRLEDGRFMVFLFGLSRARIREVSSDSPYRVVEAEPAQERPPPEAQEGPLREALGAALTAIDAEVEQVPEEVPIGALADWLLMRTPMVHERFNELFMELDIAKRAQGVLAEHEHRDPGDGDGEGD